ncbi:hypothetical protein RAD15_39090 [Bradyrhizobium sp. 14AA]
MATLKAAVAGGEPLGEDKSTRIFDTDLREKFFQCTEGVLEKARQRKAVEFPESIKEIETVDEVMAALRRAHGNDSKCRRSVISLPKGVQDTAIISPSVAPVRS